MPATGQSRSSSDGSRIFSTQTRVDALGPQALEVAGRVGEAVRVVDAQAVDEAGANELERPAVGRLEDLGVLLAQRGEVVDVEEAPVAPGRVEIEELRLELGVCTTSGSRRSRHVVGDDVEHDAEPGGCQAGELLLAAELGAEPRRVDDVVAVRRPARACSDGDR